MAKDPAVLFYTSDFLSGTFTMSDEQVGKYIRLLCLQHQKGFLTKKDMINICKTYDEDVYCKFIVIGDKYYNEKMKFEADRRKAYSESRRKNRENAESGSNMHNDAVTTKKISKSYVKHMETETETETEDQKKEVKKNFKNIPPMISEIIQRGKELEYKNIEYEAERFFNHYESNGWKVGKNPMKNWSASLTNWYKNINQFRPNGIHKPKLDLEPEKF